MSYTKLESKMRESSKIAKDAYLDDDPDKAIDYAWTLGYHGVPFYDKGAICYLKKLGILEDAQSAYDSGTRQRSTPFSYANFDDIDDYLSHC